MAYTTATKVGALLPELEGDDASSLSTALAPFIEAATMIVVDVLGTQDYTDAKFELIERWLSAHFYRVSQGEVMSETVGPVASTFLFKTGYGLHQTRHGQQAIILDTSGKLSSFNDDMITGRGGRSVGVYYVGGGIDV